MGDIQVLLIDDDPSALKGLAIYLRTMAQFEVRECDNGEAALKHLAISWEDYTAVLLDFVLAPPCSGEQVLERIHEQYPLLPVIVFTGRDPAGGVGALAKGAYRYMRRPINLAEMANIVRNLAEQDMIFHEMARDVRRMLGSDMCLAWRMDRREHRFHVAAWDGDKELDEDYRRTVFLDLDYPATSELFVKGQPIYLRDVKDPKSAPHYQHREQARKQGWTSLISIPLVRQQRVIGLVDSYTYKPFEFAEEERHRWLRVILPAFAKQAAEAVRNAALFDQFQVLHGINQILAGTFEEKSLIRQILAKGLELVGTDIGWLFLMDMDTGKLVLKDGLGVPGELIGHERELGEGITGWVAKTGIALNVPDVSKEPRHRAVPGLDIESEIAVPLRREEQTIGVLTAKSRFLDAFTDDDMNALMALAAQAAIVIGRAALPRHLQEVSRLVLAGDYGKLTNYVVNAARDLTGADVLLCMMSDREGERGQFLRIDSWAGDFDQDYVQNTTVPITPGSSITAVALEQAKPVVRADILDESEKPEEPRFYEMEKAIQQGWRSFMAVPLLASIGERLGALTLRSREVARFGEPEVELMRSFANQASIAIENARILNELNERATQLERLHAVTTAISGAIEVEEVLRLIVTGLSDTFTGASCAIRLYNSKTDEFAPQVGTGILENLVDLVPRPTGTSRHVVQKKAPRYLEGHELTTPTDGGPRIRPEILEQGVKATAYLPLLSEEDVIGILYVDFSAPRRFSLNDKRILELFADQAAIAIENAHLLADLQRQVGGHRALNEVGAELVAMLDEDEILNKVARSAADTLDCTHCSVFRLEADELVVRATHGTREWSLQPGRTFKLGQGLAGWVAQEGKSAVVPNTLEDLHFEKGWSKPEPDPQSLVVVPIFLEEKTYGVISAEQDRVAAFDEYDQRLLETLALQTSQAVRNARLHADLKLQIKRLQTLNQVSRELSAELDPDAIFKIAVKAVIQTLDCTHCTVFVLEDDLLVPRASHSKGIDIRITRRFALGEGLAGWAAQEGKSLLTQDAKKDKRFSRGNTRPEVNRSMVVAPLKIGGQVFGVISADQDQVNAFDERDLEMVDTLALQTGIAIQNALYFEQLQEDLRQTKALYDIGQALSAELDYRRVLDLILEKAQDIIPFEHGSVNLIDERLNRLVMERSVGLPEGIEPVRTEIGEGITGWVAKHGRSLCVADVTEIPEIPDVPEQPTYVQLLGDTRSESCVPLKIKGEVIGVLNVESPRIGAFDKKDQEQLETLASQAAIAIENARLYQNLGRRIKELEVLTEIGRTVSNLGVDEILDLVYEQAGKIMKLSDAQVQIAFYDEAKDEVTFPLAVEQDNGEVIDVVRWSKRESEFREEGEDEVVKQFKPRPRGTRFGLTEYVIHTAQPVLIVEDFEQQAEKRGIQVWPTFGRLHRPTHSWLGVPLIVQNRVIGIISIQSLEVEHAFDEGHVELLTTVASQAAVAIENARLYQDLEQKIRELEKAQNRLVTAERLTITNQIAAEFMHRLGNLAGTIPFRVALAEEQLDRTDPRDRAIWRALEGIRADTDAVLKMARNLEKPGKRLTLEHTDLNRFLRIALARQGIPSNVEVQEDLSPGLPLVDIPREQFMETVKNLLTNAIDAMPEGGSLSISTRAVSHDGEDYVEVKVADNGVGIPTEDLNRVFELFFTTKPDGLGYGLWRDRNLVEALGGEISVESEPGYGSTFTVLLPASN